MAVETELKLSIRRARQLRRHRCSPASSRNASALPTPTTTHTGARSQATPDCLAPPADRLGQLLTVKSAEPAAGGLAQRSEWEAPSLPGAFDFSHVDDRRLRAQLEELTPALLLVFSTDFLRTTWLLEPAPGIPHRDGAGSWCRAL